MEFFLDQIKMLLPVLGFFFVQPTPTPQSKPALKYENNLTPEKAVELEGQYASPLFYMSPVGTYAIAQEIDNEFVVSEGSAARKEGIPSWTSYRLLREQLLQDGKLAEDEKPGLLVFTESVSFPSPSAAAAVVFGSNQNGRKAWKTEDGKTYAKWQEDKLEQATSTLPT